LTRGGCSSIVRAVEHMEGPAALTRKGERCACGSGRTGGVAPPCVRGGCAELWGLRSL
jgi:hypothetical protein